MADARHLFTSESVTEGHPDKICDQISDAVLDAFLTGDTKARVAIETAVNTGLVLVFGEATANCYVDIPTVVRNTVEEIGYKGDEYKHAGFDAKTCAVISSIDEQSQDISAGVTKALEVRDGQGDAADETGAGDQGLMFGFACDETPELMPLPISVSHKLAYRLTEVRKNGTLPYLRPDGKTQVTVEYVNGVPTRIDTIVISTQHDSVINGTDDNAKMQQTIYNDLIKHVVEPVCAQYDVRPDAQTRYLINPSGRFVIGGPQGDSGLTGRKIIVDTYGGYARHGGGAFSGKDPTKVDRSAAYAARWVAKNMVAAGLAKYCEVQVSYAIGVARPVSICVDTRGTGVKSDTELAELVNKHFDLRPAAIIRDFDLQGLPGKNGGKFYQNLAAYGHLGRTDLNLPWEKLSKVEELRAEVQNGNKQAVGV
jgi:S-adenosylmethionine synthetase